MSVTLVIEEKKWRTRRGLAARLKRAAALALARGGNANGALTILLSNDRRLRALNVSFRGKDKATNVLSFPAADLPEGPQRPLGDLVICPDVLRAEAREQNKKLRAHWAHLVVHGALHLVGYDHERPVDAQRMERREIDVLRRLGFPNPYRS